MSGSVSCAPFDDREESVLMMLGIGFSVNKDTPTYKVEDPKKVLTIEEMNA